MTHTLKEVIDTLKQIAVEMPNNQTLCFYTIEGHEAFTARSGVDEAVTCPTAEAPLCVIGHLVSRLDGVEGLQKLIENRAVDEQIDVFNSLGYTDEALSYMSRVQRIHDDGETFQAAVEAGTAGA